MSRKDDSIPHILEYLTQTKGKPFKNKDELQQFCALTDEVQRQDFASKRIPADTTQAVINQPLGHGVGMAVYA